jgi:tRNA pseudouridine38-40 synthase
MIRVRIDLGYDGSGFSGWARQPGQRTVQQTLEEALGTVLRLPEAPQLTVAGRTDAGVHARGQVAHADLPAPCWEAAVGQNTGQEADPETGQPVGQAADLDSGQPPAAPAVGAGIFSLRRRLVGVLPPDVRVRSIAPAPAGFDARFSARWRRYAYRVCDDPAAADPLRRHETLWYPRPLSIDAMNEAARACLGEHDFAAFCRRREGASTIRELLRLEWERPEPSLALATVVADAFCHNMVRALVGALLRVGDGAKAAGWPAHVLAAAQRDPGVPVVAPHGLCLEEIGYPPTGELADRARATRRVRSA